MIGNALIYKTRAHCWNSDWGPHDLLEAYLHHLCVVTVVEVGRVDFNRTVAGERYPYVAAYWHTVCFDCAMCRKSSRRAVTVLARRACICGVGMWNILVDNVTSLSKL